jgi:hypothetical protein
MAKGEEKGERKRKGEKEREEGEKGRMTCGLILFFGE